MISAYALLETFIVTFFYTTGNSTTRDNDHNQFTDDNRNESHCFGNPLAFSNYAAFHQKKLAENQYKKFLIYECNGYCGGYGNRIQGITMSLLFAILSDRIFLIQMKHPFDISKLLHPNVIQWNSTVYTDIKNSTNKNFWLIDKSRLDRNWASFSKDIFNPDINAITLHTDLGFFWYYKIFDDKWRKLFHDQFNITQDHYILTYGCVIQYLFAYDKVVTEAIKKEMQELSLTSGLYVSIHFRSYQEVVKIPYRDPNPFLKRGIKVANEMSNKLNKTFKVYLVSDSYKVDKIATSEYNGQITVSHVEKVHVDRGKGSLYEGFIGVMVNIEVAAKGAVFIKTASSTFSDLIESTGQFNKDRVVYL